MRPHKVGCQSSDFAYMITSIFLRDLCRYVWVNILTLSPLKVEHSVQVWNTIFKKTSAKGTGEMWSAKTGSILA